MGCLPLSALRRVARLAWAAVAALPLPLAAATTMTVRLDVSSAVAASPGICVFSPAAANHAVSSPAGLDFAVSCSGSSPYYVAIDGSDSVFTLPPLVIGGSIAAGHTDAPVRQTFTLPWPVQPLDPTAGALRRAVTATVQY